VTGDHQHAVRTGDHVPVSEAPLWFGLASGPAAWSLHELFGWFFGARVCSPLTLPAVRLIVAGLTAAALAIALGGAAVSWRTWQRATESAGPPGAEAWDRTVFMAMGGFLVSAVSVVALVWAGLPSLLLDTCGWMR
jgi:hypothetical protein